MQNSPTLEHNWQDKSISAKPEIYYPESDGRFIGATDWHTSAIAYLHTALRFVFRHNADIYVSGGIRFYYSENEPTIFEVPDVFVVKGVAKHNRSAYRLWQEKASPCVIFEITSRDTKWEDVAAQKGLYARLGVREYFLFDPLADCLTPHFQGFRLLNEHYESLMPTKDGAMISNELGIILRPDENMVRVVDPKTGVEIPSLEEVAEKAGEVSKIDKLEAQRAQAEAQRANAAEAEVARLQAELEKLKRQSPGQ